MYNEKTVTTSTKTFQSTLIDFEFKFHASIFWCPHSVFYSARRITIVRSKYALSDDCIDDCHERTGNHAYYEIILSCKSVSRHCAVVREQWNIPHRAPPICTTIKGILVSITYAQTAKTNPHQLLIVITSTSFLISSGQLYCALRDSVIIESPWF